MEYIGKKEENVEYIKRPGAYAIITRDEDNKVAIATDGEFFFLGGGIENKETEIETLKREIIEEAGYSIKNIKDFGKFYAYIYSAARGYLDIESTVYIAQFDEKIVEPIEKDHQVLWIRPEEYIDKMAHEYQGHILKKYIDWRDSNE